MLLIFEAVTKKSFSYFRLRAALNFALARRSDMISQTYKRPLNVREAIASLFNFCSMLSVWALVVYETLSFFDWLTKGEVLRHRTCELVDTIFRTHYCTYSFSSSMVGLNRIVDSLLSGDVAAGLVVIAAVFALLAYWIGPEDEWSATHLRERRN
jgi:hypothetical protein